MISKRCLGVLAAASYLAVACGSSSSSGGRRLWLNVPHDGTVILDDHQPPPF